MTTVAVPLATRPGRSVAWWGMMLVIATEATLFACLLAAWFFLRAASHQWPPPGIEAPELTLSTIFSFVLWGSSLPTLYAERALKRGRVGGFRSGMAVAWLLGAAFLAYTAYDFHELHYGWRDHAYGTAFYTIVGLHTLHVVVGLAMSAVVQLKAALGRYDAGHHRSAEVVALYWHFVDVVWLFVFPSLFLATHVR